MRIALISDIHSNIDALDAVLDDIARQGVERIVNLGDSLSGPFAPRETAERLVPLELPTVSGNHDRMLVDRPAQEMGTWEAWAIGELDTVHLDWLSTLPPVIDEGELLFCHATPGDDSENWLDHRGPQDRLVARDLPDVVARLGDAGARVIACGHTHTPRAVRLGGGTLIVNPGSVGCPAYLDTRMEPHFIHQTGAADARYAILENVGGDWRAIHLTVPYDRTEMIRRAVERGADSWAAALSSGWLA